MWVQSLGWEDPPEEAMAAPSSILAWRISKYTPNCYEDETGNLNMFKALKVDLIVNDFFNIMKFH